MTAEARSIAATGRSQPAQPAQHSALGVRDLRKEDLAGVIRIDADHTGVAKPQYWRDVFESFVGSRPRPSRVGLAATSGGELVGYLLGEVRAFEFDSEPCGWVFAIGVDRPQLGTGVGRDLLQRACRRFLDMGVDRVRTMVRRDDIPVMSFFRSSGFVGGAFYQLEIDLLEEKR